MPKVVVYNHFARDRRPIGKFRAVAGVKDDCGCGCGGKGDCNHDHHDASPLEKAKKNYLRQSDLLTKAHQEVRALTANKQKTKALVNEVYDRYDQVKKDFEAAKQELAKLERGALDKAPPGYAKAELGIDVLYRKGPMGNYKEERKHYSIPEFLVDPRGRPPEPAAVAAALRKLPEHIRMHNDGWRADKAEGYYKREGRDFGRKL